MTDRPSFRRHQNRLPTASEPRLRAMAAVLLLCVALFVGRRWLLPASVTPVASTPVVQVRGEVPQPGFYEAATVHEALRAAGAPTDGLADAILQAGTAVIVESSGTNGTGRSIRLAQMDDVLVFGLPIDLNSASAEALEAIPGIGATRAAAIVADRNHHGDYDQLEDLDRVRGIGPATIENLRPFVTVDHAP